MTLLFDMNISPRLVDLLQMQGIASMHWVAIGKSNASDAEIMDYAFQNDCIVVTYDLDFSTILSITQAKKPSVIQIRKHALELSMLAELLILAMSHWHHELDRGAVLSLDTKQGRVRLLPLFTPKP